MLRTTMSLALVALLGLNPATAADQVNPRQGPGQAGHCEEGRRQASRRPEGGGETRTR